MTDLDHELFRNGQTLAARGRSVTPPVLPLASEPRTEHIRRPAVFGLAMALTIAAFLPVAWLVRNASGPTSPEDSPWIAIPREPDSFPITRPPIASSTPTTAGRVPSDVAPFGSTPRVGSSAIWTGTELIIWGGRVLDGPVVEEGARWSSDLDEWVELPNGPLTGTIGHTAVWDRSRMIVAGPTGVASYSPSADSWTDLPEPPFRLTSLGTTGTSQPATQYAWDGEVLYIWNVSTDEFAAFDTTNDKWRVLPGPGLEVEPNALLVGGGRIYALGTRWDGGRFEPATNQLYVSVFEGETWAAAPSISFETAEYAAPAAPTSAAVLREGLIVWGLPVPRPAPARILDLAGLWIETPPPPLPPENIVNAPLVIDEHVLAVSEAGVGYLRSPNSGEWTSIGQVPFSSSNEAIWTGEFVVGWNGMDVVVWEVPISD